VRRGRTRPGSRFRKPSLPSPTPQILARTAAPARRTRPSGAAPTATSSSPRPMVLRAIPVMRDTAAIPPQQRPTPRSLQKPAAAARPDTGTASRTVVVSPLRRSRIYIRHKPPRLKHQMLKIPRLLASPEERHCTHDDAAVSRAARGYERIFIETCDVNLNLIGSSTRQSAGRASGWKVRNIGRLARWKTRRPSASGSLSLRTIP
jgi:hypothetical protein